MAYPGASTFPGANTFPGVDVPEVPGAAVLSGFDVRLRRYTPAGVKGKVISALNIDMDDVKGDSPKLTFKTSERQAGFLPVPFMVALEYTSGGPWVEPRNARFVVDKDDVDAADPSGVVTFTGEGVFGFYLPDSQVSWVPGVVDNKRQFTSASAGAILAPMFDEAKNAGWGPGLSRSFSTGTDTFGASWPAGDRISQEWSIGTPLSQVLETLSSGGLCEWWGEGLALRLAVAGTGVDRTSGSGLVRLGPGATKVPVKSDFSKVFNHLTVAREDGGFTYLANPGVAGEWGTIRKTVSIRGAIDEATAIRLAQPTLIDGRATHRQIGLSYPAAAAKYLPWVHYDVGDQIQARTRAGWENLRVVELVVQKDASGVVTVSTVLSHRFRNLVSRLAGRASASAIGGGTGLGGGAPLPPEAMPIMPPKAPTGLVLVSNTGFFTADGTARSTVKVAWAAVTQSLDDSNVDVSAYEVWVASNGGVSQRVTTVSAPAASVELAPGIPVEISVRAISGPRVSLFSTPLPVTPAVPLTVMPAPPAPSLTVEMGVVTAAWNGLLAGATPPSGFAHVYAEWATTSGGSYTRFGAQLAGKGGAQLLDRPLGSTVWVRFRAVSTVGVVSAPSTAASIVVVGIEADDLEVDEIWGNSAFFGKVQSQHLTVGTRPAQGEANQRVPAPLTDSVYWGQVIDGSIDFDSPVTTEQVAASADGVVFTPTVGDATLGVTATHPVPASRKLHLSVLQSGTAVQARTRWFDSAGAVVATTGGVGELTAPDTAASYATYLEAGSGQTASTVVDARVFEVIGDGPGGGAYVEISPRGFRSVSEGGALVAELTANADNFLSLQKWNGVGYDPITTFDDGGGGLLQNLSVNSDITVRGFELLGDYTTVLRNGIPDGGPIINRVSRGAVLGGFYSSLSIGQTYVNDYLSVASAHFTTDEGRRYMFSVDDTSYIFHNGAGGVVFAEVLISDNPIDVNATTGYQVVSSIAISPGMTQTKPFAMSRAMYAATGVGSGAFRAAGTYLMLRFRLTPTASFHYSNGAGSNALPSTISIVDIGPDFGMNVDYTDVVAGSGSMSPPARYTTTWTHASWSASYRNGGANMVTGSGQYDNASYLYQGAGTGAMGARFGFPPLGLAGKTILSVRLYMRNLYSDDPSGVSAALGTHGLSTAPASISGTGGNLAFVPFRRGEGKWITLLSPAIASGLQTGTIRGFTLGVDSGGFGYWQGGGSNSERPILEVTYR